MKCAECCHVVAVAFPVCCATRKLFSFSCRFPSVHIPQTPTSHPTTYAGVIEVAEGLDERVCRTNPIRCRVSGGYTISKLSGYGAHSSPETLLTCVLQVCLWVL